MIRILPVTRRLAVVAAVAVCAGGTPARAGEEGSDPAADLRRAASPSTPAAERATIVSRLVASGAMPDPDTAARVAFRHFLENVSAGSAGEATTLLRRALEAGSVSEDAMAPIRAWASHFTGEPSGEPMKVDASAIAILAGARKEAYRLLSQTSSTPTAREAIGFDAPEMLPLPNTTRPLVSDVDAWARHVEAAELMDAAVSDDPKVSFPALDALVAKKDAAMPYLLAVAKRRPEGTPAGLLPRRVRAILVLGKAKDRRARPVLEAALMDNVDAHDEGWARVAAATALGDLGDPAAIPALCHVLFYLGDIHRVPDAWDYPGKGNTDIPEEAWSEAEYYTVDIATADTLLRLGVGNVAEWLIRERLLVSATRWRIRILYDAVDALRRAFPDAPRTYVPDGGLPDRDQAGKELLAWWSKGPRLPHPLNEDDPGFVEAARALVARLGEKGVMEMQIAEHAAALIGPPMTPVLLAGLSASKKKLQRQEIAGVLGTVRDRRAVRPLLDLTRDEAGNVRAMAAKSLAAYLETGDDPLFAGKAEASTGEIVKRWIEMLDDEEEAPRASAIRALSTCPPRPDVLAAVRAHASSAHPENAFDDYVLAEEVVLLVQTGEGLEKVAAALLDPVLLHRRTAWELLARALALPPADFDPTPDPVPQPGQPAAKPVDLPALKAALAKRRAS